jgi:hypothetical protein
MKKLRSTVAIEVAEEKYFFCALCSLPAIFSAIVRRQPEAGWPFRGYSYLFICANLR